MRKFRIIIITELLFFALTSGYAQEKLPNHSISLSSGIDVNDGYETILGTEYYFNSNHKVSLYGLFNYHFTKELWFGESVTCKKAMMEIGGKKYFAVVKEKFYPYVGLGLTAGVQDLTQNTFVNFNESIINKDTDPLILGGVGTIGLEYLFTRNISIELISRFKYDRSIHCIIGGGLKFSF